MVTVTSCKMPLTSTIPTDSTVICVCVECWRAQVVTTHIRALNFGPMDLPYDRSSMPWVIMRPVICWFCKSVTRAQQYCSEYNFSALYKKVSLKDYEQILGSRLTIECDTLLPATPLGIFMCDEMINNTTAFTPELASDLLSQFTSGYIMRSVKSSSMDGPHQDFFYFGHAGDRSDEFYRLSWTKHTNAICFSCERAILFMAQGSKTPPSWGPEGEERTTDVNIVCCSICGHFSHFDAKKQSEAVGRLIRKHDASVIINTSPYWPVFVLGDGEVNIERTSQLITDLQKLAANMIPHSVVRSVDTELGEVKMLEENFLHFYL